MHRDRERVRAAAREALGMYLIAPAYLDMFAQAGFAIPEKITKVSVPAGANLLEDEARRVRHATFISPGRVAGLCPARGGGALAP